MVRLSTVVTISALIMHAIVQNCIQYIYVYKFIDELVRLKFFGKAYIAKLIVTFKSIRKC